MVNHRLILQCVVRYNFSSYSRLHHSSTVYYALNSAVLPWEIQSIQKHHVKESIASHEFFINLPIVMLSLMEASGKDKSELLIVVGKSLFGYSGTIAHAMVRQVPVMCRRRDIIVAGPSSSVFWNHMKLFFWWRCHPIHFSNNHLALLHAVCRIWQSSTRIS